MFCSNKIYLSHGCFNRNGKILNKHTIIMSSTSALRCSMCDKAHVDDDCPYFNAAETRKAREVAAARERGWAIQTLELNRHELQLIAQGQKKCKQCNQMIRPENFASICQYHTGCDSRDGMAFYWYRHTKRHPHHFH